MQLICVSRDPGGRGQWTLRAASPSLGRGGKGGPWSFSASPRPGYLLRGEFSSPRGLSGPGLTQRGPRAGVWTTALRGPRRGAPWRQVPGARAQRDGLPPSSPPSPGAPRRHSPRSGPRTAGRAALGLRQARSGPGSGGGRAIVRCIVGAARAGARAVEGAAPRDLYGPARPPARAAGAVRGRRAGTAGSGAGARAPPPLSASAPRALGLGSRRLGRRRHGVAGPAAACFSPAAPSAAPGAAHGLLGSGRLPALLPMHG